jgi:hypothetical protein
MVTEAVLVVSDSVVVSTVDPVPGNVVGVIVVKD